ncbi:7299_t:CDS:2 [Entrophospora sp. SA101]|nr:1591_t:CDS:2 [Entrophospora sp. SA101]CAJ0835488.1 7299_t:CDS:2 [Entrophospora sp. SA101]
MATSLRFVRNLSTRAFKPNNFKKLSIANTNASNASNSNGIFIANNNGMLFPNTTTTTTNSIFIRNQYAIIARKSSTTTNNESNKAGGSGGSSGGNSALWLGAGLVAVGVGYFAYNSETILASLQNLNPATPSPKTATTPDYQKIYYEIADILEDDNHDDGNFGPLFIRLAWHAAGTYDKETNTGGSNGATMRFSPESHHGANLGLQLARDKLEEVKKKNPEISYSDLWSLAAVVAIQEMGGPIVPWIPGRLPDATKDTDHLRDIFYRMGFDDREIVALSGAHALGRCHPDRSGFDGPWTFSPTTVTNGFYKELLEKKWVEKKWKGPKQYIDKETGNLMMLPTDIALTKDKKMRPWVEKYAKDEELWFKDFSEVFHKLEELGIPRTGQETIYRFKRTGE